MGRKKRPAASASLGPPTGAHHHAPPAYPNYHQHAPPLPGSLPPPPMPPPIPPPSSDPNNGNKNNTNNTNNTNKKQKPNGESYPVKKYRPSSNSYRVIEAFQRYTKSQRMSDARFSLLQPPGRGATPSSPIVFAILINNQSLSWGRGKNKDVAIDNACRAAFALFAAHGYEYELNEDSLMTEPFEILNTQPPPPPPPPPLPMGIPPHPMSKCTVLVMFIMVLCYCSAYCNVCLRVWFLKVWHFFQILNPHLCFSLFLLVGLPPPPNGMAPPLPPPRPVAAAVLIPQPKAMDSTLASASSVGANVTVMNTITGTGTSSNHATITASSGLTLNLDKHHHHQSAMSNMASALSSSSQVFKKKKIKGGLTLVYDAEQEGNAGGSGGGETIIRSMEERRSLHARYSKVMNTCWEKRRRELLSLQQQ